MRTTIGIVVGLSLVGCSGEENRTEAQMSTIGMATMGNGGDGTGDSQDTEGGNGEGDSNGGAGSSSGEPDGFDSGPKFDVPPGSSPSAVDTDGCGTECECTIPDHQACDGATGDPFLAMGLGCPGELAVQTTVTGPPGAIGVRSSFGGTATYAPREGSSYAVIGTGFVTDLDLQTPAFDADIFPTHCNDDIGGQWDVGALPPPLRTNNVAGDCIANPALLGTGDCSNTIASQFSQGGAAYDYVELRFDLDVPLDVVSLSYDFAFFSTEYPWYYGSEYNDMYVGWLESEAWTGNISFDAAGNPISLNAGFLDYRDDFANLPEFAGTCMRQHAGTGWLSTNAGVVPGEHITVAFAIFDLSDSALDSYVFLDNFQWGCEAGAPTTTPEG